MNSANSWKSYRQIAAQTAPPGPLVLMLFDGALHSLERALTGFDYDDPREKNQTIHNNLQRAVDIIRTLNSCLNLEAGGKLAETLRNLYDYFDRRIVESNMKKRRDGVIEVMGCLRELRDAWATMLTNQGKESQSQPGLDDALLSEARAA
ncbi:MAG TPA: flagellar export chaperone FliS [Verrucomicrobiae bacterium]